MNKLRHIVVMVQKHVSFDAAFDFLELCPRKQRQAQRNGCGIQQEQLVLKTKWFLSWPQHRLAAKSFQCFPKQLLKQGRWPIFIRISQTGFVRRLRQSKMFQFTEATTQTIADDSQRVGVGQMTKQHCDKLCPTGKSARMSFGFGVLYQGTKFRAREMMKKLIKQTGGLYHVLALLLRPVSHPPSQRSDAIQHIIGGHFSFSGPSWKANSDTCGHRPPLQWDRQDIKGETLVAD